MRIALQLAKSVKGQTGPNPPVGAVIVKDGVIRGLGAHLKAGEAHAEVHAINMAGEHAKNGTMYVTLEPCSHTGKTAPCAELIIEKEITRVVIATKDPNEKVSGKGIERLKQAGIDVQVGLLEDEALQINDIFFHYIKTKRPFITLKSAVSLDGKIATKTGESKWITSDESRQDVHYYRHIHDAILVGVNTVLKDNPKLTTRFEHGGKSPKRIVLDTNLNTPLKAHIVQQDDAETIIFVGSKVSKAKIEQFNKYQHVNIVQLKTEDICITHIVGILGKMGISSLFVEGGATVNDSFLRAGLINKFILYITPKLIGGKEAPTSFGGKGITSISEAFSLNIIDIKKIGADVKIIALPKEES